MSFINKSLSYRFEVFFPYFYKLFSFSLSEKTINSLVNNGSLRADDAIEFIKNMELQIGNCANLENIILDDIE